MQRNRPPFRADMVGSLLRTAALKEARDQHQQGRLSADGLREVEDREIRCLIKRQEAIGSKPSPTGSSAGLTGTSISWSISTGSPRSRPIQE